MHRLGSYAPVPAAACALLASSYGTSCKSDGESIEAAAHRVARPLQGEPIYVLGNLNVNTKNPLLFPAVALGFLPPSTPENADGSAANGTRVAVRITHEDNGWHSWHRSFDGLFADSKVACKGSNGSCTVNEVVGPLTFSFTEETHVVSETNPTSRIIWRHYSTKAFGAVPLPTSLGSVVVEMIDHMDGKGFDLDVCASIPLVQQLVGAECILFRYDGPLRIVSEADPAAFDECRALLGE